MLLEEVALEVAALEEETVAEDVAVEDAVEDLALEETPGLLQPMMRKEDAKTIKLVTRKCFLFIKTSAFCEFIIGIKRIYKKTRQTRFLDFLFILLLKTI